MKVNEGEMAIMNIQFTPAAAEAIRPELAGGLRRLKLLYDTEGCGCVVSGVPALQFVDRPGPDDREGEGDPFPFLYEPRHEVFFEPKMKIDYDAERGAFVLKSDGQIYTNHLRLLR